MSPNARPITQEVPTVDFLAKEAKDFLVYAAQVAVQEGRADILRVIYDGLDIEKILAFVAVEGNHLGDYPKEVVELLLKDQRKAVMDVLNANPSVLEFTQFLSAKEILKARGETTEEGVRVIEKMARRASLRKSLRDDEIEGFRSMAREFLDHRVIEAIFPLAENNQKIALELVYNSGLNSAQADRLVDLALRKMGQDSDWSMVVMELIANPDRHALLSASSLGKIQSNPDVGVYLNLWNSPGKAGSKVIDLQRTGNKRRHTPAERKARREEDRAGRVMDNDWGKEEPMDEAVNY